MVTVESTWDESAGVLRTTLSGDASVTDVGEWERGLRQVLSTLPPGTRFKLLYDLRGFRPGDLSAHRAMREVVPGVLAAHGMRPAVADLFDPPPAVTVSHTPAAVCVGFANVHHDQVKMNDYERRVGRPDQRFFSDFEAAAGWLRALARG